MLQKQKRQVMLSASFAGIILLNVVCHAQVLSPDIPANKSFALAEEQFEQQQYALCAQSARTYLQQEAVSNIQMPKATDIEKIKCYLTLSSIMLNTPGCIDSANAMIIQMRNSAYKQRIAYTVAQYYFQYNKLADAIPYYEMTGIANLSNKEITDEKFELAYCYFNSRNFDKAEPLFASMKELKDGKYYLAGNYYYGLLAYNENEYKEALQSFGRIKENKQYRDIVPYYIAEIYYFEGNRNKALEEAEKLIKRSDKLYYDNELHLLAAQCLFEDGQYSNALPYFEHYYDNTDKIRKEDLYEMAYCYYRTDDWQNAVDKFKELNTTQDSLGQTSMYLLGDCYLKIADRQSARSAFGLCADIPYNKGQQQASMMLYAKLSSEMGYDDDAIHQLNNLLNTFPNSEYTDEAKTLLSDLLIKTNDYVEALDQLNDVRKKDENYMLVYQKVTYGYAMQQFLKGDIKPADSLLALSLEHPVNSIYEAAANFWQGECAYRLHQYKNVISSSQQFVDEKVNNTTLLRLAPQATQQHAYLNMGYAAMELQKYEEAQKYFSLAQETKNEDNTADEIAILREADAVFMQKNYSKAVALYDKVIAMEGDDADYARYQKSILLGLQGKQKDKLALLQYIIDRKSLSNYAGNAYYEAALTYIEMNNYTLALPYLQTLSDSLADKSFAPKALMKTGFIYQQTNDNNKAIEAYTRVAINYPASEERPAALDALKNLYIQTNQLAVYTKFLKDNNLPSADSSAIDSAYYAAAENQFANSKWEQAQLAFAEYLKQYPNGAFAIKAHYYRAESNYMLKNYKDALPDYNFVLTNPWNDFSENSAARAAAIAYSEKDYGNALNYYLKLRNYTSDNSVLQTAFKGLMKTSYDSGNFNDAIKYSDSIFALPGVSTETINEALLYKAKSLQHSDKADDALSLYNQIKDMKNGEVGAEALYRIAEIHFNQSNLKEAEKDADETRRQTEGYDYWNVSSYILLSDILVKEKDYFNAKVTLQSVVKNTKIEELKRVAEDKLKEVIVLEKKHSKLSDE